MSVRFNTNHYRLLTAFALSFVAILCAHAQAASPASEPDRIVESAPPAAFRVAPAKGTFAYRSGIPLVEQFMKKWDARRRS